MNSEADKAETAWRPDKTDTTLQTEDKPFQVFEPKRIPSTSIKADTSHQVHQSQQYATDKTRVAAETLELLWGTDDLDKTPPEEAAYFEGSGLLDHICCSQMKKKGLQSHQMYNSWQLI